MNVATHGGFVPHRCETLKFCHSPLAVVHVLAQERRWLQRLRRKGGWRGLSGGRFPALPAPAAHEAVRFVF